MRKSITNIDVTIALMSNIANTYIAQTNNIISTSLNSSELNLLGISASLSSIVDNILLSMSSAQFIIAHNASGIQSTPMNATFTVTRFGDTTYIWVVASINMIILVVFVIEAIRNNGWKGHTKFNYQDLKSIVVGTSAGGKEICDEISRRTNGMDSKWEGDSNDLRTGGIKVLLQTKNHLALTLGNEEIEMST